jgi:hypothetical protein
MRVNLRRLWRPRSPDDYRDDMGVARRSSRVKTVPRPGVLDAYQGEWVALLDGEVIAHSVSSREVVRQLKKMGAAGEDAVLMRSAAPTDALAVGLG